MHTKKIIEYFSLFFSNNRPIHVANILIGFNVLVFISSAYAFYLNGHNSSYVNSETMIMAFFIAMQIHFSLSIRKLKSDPFVLILSSITIIYYCFRIFTLLIFDTSDTIIRNEAYTANDTTYALYVIFLCNLSMLAAFYFVARKKTQYFKFTSHNYNHFINSLLVLVPILLILHILNVWLVIASFSRVAIASLSLINIHWFIYFSMIIILFRQTRNLSVLKSQNFFILVLIMIYGFWLMVSGSRGYFIFFIEISLVGLISLNQFYIKKRQALKFLLFAPAILFIFYVVFMFASDQRIHVSSKQKITGIFNNFESLLYQHKHDTNEIISNLKKLTNRVGYLDMSSEIISNRNKYDFLFTPNFYAKSFVDNIFTPGFDIFDTPKVARSLYFIHQDVNNKIPSKKFGINNNIIHSDMLTIYGEFFMFFGWWALAIIFLWAYLLKWLYYLKLKKVNFMLGIFKRPTILLLFYFCLNSFGIDWIISTYLAPIIFTLISLSIYHKFFFRKK